MRAMIRSCRCASLDWASHRHRNRLEKGRPGGNSIGDDRDVIPFRRVIQSAA